MLTPALAHTGVPVRPHDLWTTWNLDPPVVAGLLLIAALYWRGSRRGSRPGQARRDRAFWGAILVIVVAIVSPLEPLADALASAHMVQHVLLILIAAPLLALSSPSSAVLRGAPPPVRRFRGRLRMRAPRFAAALRTPSHPALLWLLHVAVLWLWHSAATYDAAVGNAWLHTAEHASFVITAVWFWTVILGPRRTRRVPEGLGLLLVFGMTMQSVFLSVLLTFAREPWYAAYRDTTAAWNLTPLADQQLAGVLMWVPAGAVYLGCALLVFTRWMQSAGPASEVTLPEVAAGTAYGHGRRASHRHGHVAARVSPRGRSR